MLRASLICLSLTLCGCATPRTVTQTVTVPIRVSEALRVPCVAPVMADELRVRDVYENRDRWRSAFEQCSADHDALIAATELE
jgi:hypothetical protein